MIELKHISKTFPTADGVFQALDDINLTIRDGDIFGIVGMSGAGKSTLVRCINLLERPTAGQVVIDGQDLMELSAPQLREKRRSISMIFQQFNLLMQRTCLGNICFPMEIAGVPKGEARKRALEYLDIVGLPDKANAYPAQLSGGQKQRIAIARALASNPKVLLCDEATSALDPTTTRSILKLIQDINRRMGITAVIITHEMAVVERSAPTWPSWSAAAWWRPAQWRRCSPTLRPRQAAGWCSRRGPTSTSFPWRAWCGWCSTAAPPTSPSSPPWPSTAA